ncbi:helix-turn-helix domain-containing protein [Magnetovibrio sp. PR-2]|uniref:helix-turn-helix domain-containing protein n=1 Tax=Magnetovibrio sp. PR-2 TaxID=3120356 RepID=UPI002FCE5E1C
MSKEHSKTVEKSFFSTRDAPEKNQPQVWRDAISTLFDVELDATNTEDGFDASLTSYLLDEQIVFTRCDSMAQKFLRGSLRVAQDGLDYYLIQTHLSGTQNICRGNTLTIAEPGDLLVMDLADHHLAETSDFTNLTYIVPRHMLAPLLNSPDTQQGRVLKAGSPLVTLAVEYMKTMNRVANTISSEDAAMTISSTLSLLASALNGSPDTVKDGISNLSHSTLMRAKLEIENNLQDADLTITTLCAKLGLSRATLFRLFKPYGGVKAYIQDRRLKRCAKDLISPSLNERRIFEIAYSWGFASEAHFSRAFKSKFGMTPGEAREAPNHIKSDNTILKESDTIDPHFTCGSKKH